MVRGSEVAPWTPASLPPKPLQGRSCHGKKDGFEGSEARVIAFLPTSRRRGTEKRPELLGVGDGGSRSGCLRTVFGEWGVMSTDPSFTGPVLPSSRQDPGPSVPRVADQSPRLWEQGGLGAVSLVRSSLGKH